MIDQHFTEPKFCIFQSQVCCCGGAKLNACGGRRRLITVPVELGRRMVFSNSRLLAQVFPQRSLCINEFLKTSRQFCHLGKVHLWPHNLTGALNNGIPIQTKRCFVALLAYGTILVYFFLESAEDSPSVNNLFIVYMCA